MKAHIASTKNKLADLAGLSSKTLAAEKKILKTAEARMETVNAELDKFAGVEGMPDEKQASYLDLVKERAQLNIVITKARSILGGD